MLGQPIFLLKKKLIKGASYPGDTQILFVFIPNSYYEDATAIFAI